VSPCLGSAPTEVNPRARQYAPTRVPQRRAPWIPHLVGDRAPSAEGYIDALILARVASGFGGCQSIEDQRVRACLPYSCDQSDGTPCRGCRASLHIYHRFPSQNPLLSSSVASGGAAHPFFLCVVLVLLGCLSFHSLRFSDQQVPYRTLTYLKGSHY